MKRIGLTVLILLVAGAIWLPCLHLLQISGTTGSIQFSWHISALLALTYIFRYLSFVLLVPILLLAALLLFVWNNIRGTKV